MVLIYVEAEVPGAGVPARVRVLVDSKGTRVPTRAGGSSTVYPVYPLVVEPLPTVVVVLDLGSGEFVFP